MPILLEETLPTTFQTPVLGHPVRLGELYDQRTKQFFTVQLYEEELMAKHVIDTNINHTDLRVSLSTKYEDKANLLDINAALSLEILGGLVKAEGSASYIKDQKSNTNEIAYAMSLKKRIKERRLEYAHPDLSRKVLEVVKEDLIEAKRVTHFVSSIEYGGNYIVNLVARKTELSEEESIKGKLKLELEKLKGSISLNGSGEVDYKDKFKNLNDKFDLIIHGDVDINTVPVNPQEVLKTFPDAATEITKNPVAISVTLQPISPEMLQPDTIYQINAGFVDRTLKAFSQLDDLSCRFAVLQKTLEELGDILPELTKRVGDCATWYSEEHDQLLRKLKRFLQESQQGNEPVAGTFSSPPGDDHNSLTNGNDGNSGNVLTKATKLWEKHQDPGWKDADYPTKRPLARLEMVFAQYQNLVSIIQTVGQSLQPETQASATVGNSFRLSSLLDISKTLIIKKKILLFVMTPMNGTNADIAISRFVALLQRHAAYFRLIPTFMFYAEDLSILESRFPNNERFASLKDPTLFLGQVDLDGTPTWTLGKDIPPKPPADFKLRLIYDSTKQHVFVPLNPVDGTKAFSLQFKASGKPTGTSSEWEQILFLISNAFSRVVTFWTRSARDFAVTYRTQESDIIRLELPSLKQPQEDFTMTFVQDTQHKQWVLFVNDDAVVRGFEGAEPDPTAETLWFFIPSPDFITKTKNPQWKGDISGIKAYARAISHEEIKAQFVSAKASKADVNTLSRPEVDVSTLELPSLDYADI